MKDTCSIQALAELKRSGKQKTDAAAVLTIFKWTGRPMTAREVLKELTGEAAVGLNGVRSRITELTEAGFLKKEGRAIELDGRCTVNCWVYTGKTGQLPTERVWEKCEHCQGRGKRPVNRQVNPAQMDFIR